MILFYNTAHLSYSRGGERYMRDLAMESHRLGIPFTFATTALFRQPRAPESPFPVAEISTAQGWPSFEEVGRLMRASDVVCFGDPFAVTTLTWRLMRLRIRKRLVCVHLGISPAAGSVVRRLYYHTVGAWAYRGCDAHLVFNSRRERWLRRHGCRNVKRIPSGVRTDWFLPDREGDEARQSTFGESPEEGIGGTYHLLFVGGLTVHKGILTVLDVAHRMFDKYRDVRLTIVGGGDVQSAVEEFCGRYPSYAKYLGQLPSESELLRRCYQMAHCLIAPSHPHADQGQLVPLEALACGTPVIISEIEGTEYLQSSLAVSKQPPFRLEDWIKAVEKLRWEYLNEQETYFARRKLAREQALTYEWSRIGAGILDFICDKQSSSSGDAPAINA